MNSRLLASILKETIVFWRDPFSRMMMFVMPVLQLFVFGYAATLEVDNVDIALLNDDTGYWSQELVARIEAAGFVEDVVRMPGRDQMVAALNERRVLIALHIPADFSRGVVAGTAPVVQLLADGRRANAAQIASSYVADIVARLGAELQPAGIAPPGAPVVRHWFNNNLEYQWFMVPSLSAMLAMMFALMLATLSIARERELGTYDQLLVSPASPYEIIISKTLPGMLVGIVVSAMVIITGVTVLGVPFRGNFLLLIVALFPFVFAVAGIGLTISSFARNQQQAFLMLFMVMIPTILCSGFATPVENMPQALQYFAEALPLKHILITVQGIFLKDMGLADVWSNTWPLLVIGSVTATMATLVVRHRLE